MTNTEAETTFRTQSKAGNSFFSKVVGHWVVPVEGGFLYYVGKGQFKTSPTA